MAKTETKKQASKLFRVRNTSDESDWFYLATDAQAAVRVFLEDSETTSAGPFDVFEEAARGRFERKTVVEFTGAIPDEEML